MTLLSRAMLTMLLTTALAAASPVGAQSVADFYRGKTLTMLVGVAVGGEYDLLARLLAKHIGRQLPGNPSAITQNVTGASGLKVLNYLYNQAPQDGTYLLLVQPTLPAAQAVGMAGVQFDAGRLHWLGTIAPSTETLVVWHAAGAKTVDEARRREVIIGATSRGSSTYAFPALMNELLGTRFKIVTGYNGGTQINLAMERGEVEGRDNSWASWKTTKPDWVKERKIVVMAQAGPRASDLDAPSVEALAESADDRRIMELVLSGGNLGRPFAVAPGVPAARASALRAAFDAVMKDTDFRAEAAALQFEVAPVDGASLQKIVDEVVSTPKDLAAPRQAFSGIAFSGKHRMPLPAAQDAIAWRSLSD